MDYKVDGSIGIAFRLLFCILGDCPDLTAVLRTASSQGPAAVAGTVCVSGTLLHFLDGVREAVGCRGYVCGHGGIDNPA